MAHLFLQKREGERKERCVKSCMALLNEKVGFRVLQISSKMLMYIFMTLGYRVPLPFEEDLHKEIFSWNFTVFC